MAPDPEAEPELVEEGVAEEVEGYAEPTALISKVSEVANTYSKLIATC